MQQRGSGTLGRAAWAGQECMCISRPSWPATSARHPPSDAASGGKPGMALLDGRWRLLYSSGFTSGSLGGRRPGPSFGSSVVTLGQVFQDIFTGEPAARLGKEKPTVFCHLPDCRKIAHRVVPTRWPPPCLDALPCGRRKLPRAAGLSCIRAALHGGLEWSSEPLQRAVARPLCRAPGVAGGGHSLERLH